MINNMPGFDEIVGQERVKTELIRIINSSKLPHSILFYGTNGVGKFNFALKFIELVLSHNNVLTEQIKNKIYSLQEPYIKYIIPLPRGKNENASDSPLEKLSKENFDAYKNEINSKIKNHYHKIEIPGANNIKINSIREIKEFLSFNLSDVKYRFILIEDAHLMSDEAQNALLKSLEEPPDGFIFILITNDINLLLETIRSRCFHIHFDPLNEEEITSILRKNFNTNEKDTESVAYFSSGSLSEALELLKINFDESQKAVINILRFCLANRISQAVKEVNKFISEDQFYMLTHLIKLLTMWLNDVQRYRNKYDRLYFKNYTETIEKFDLRYPNARIAKAIDNLYSIYNNIYHNLNLNIAVMNVIFELISLHEQV